MTTTSGRTRRTKSKLLWAWRWAGWTAPCGVTTRAPSEDNDEEEEDGDEDVGNEDEGNEQDEGEGDKENGGYWDDISRRPDPQTQDRHDVDVVAQLGGRQYDTAKGRGVRVDPRTVKLKVAHKSGTNDVAVNGGDAQTAIEFSVEATDGSAPRCENTTLAAKAELFNDRVDLKIKQVVPGNK
eukprot:jgi/Tetstr1/427944/TSEL_018019.t1